MLSKSRRLLPRMCKDLSQRQATIQPRVKSNTPSLVHSWLRPGRGLTKVSSPHWPAEAATISRSQDGILPGNAPDGIWPKISPAAG